MDLYIQVNIESIRKIYFAQDLSVTGESWINSIKQIASPGYRLNIGGRNATLTIAPFFAFTQSKVLFLYLESHQLKCKEGRNITKVLWTHCYGHTALDTLLWTSHPTSAEADIILFGSTLHSISYAIWPFVGKGQDVKSVQVHQWAFIFGPWFIFFSSFDFHLSFSFFLLFPPLCQSAVSWAKCSRADTNTQVNVCRRRREEMQMQITGNKEQADLFLSAYSVHTQTHTDTHIHTHTHTYTHIHSFSFFLYSHEHLFLSRRGKRKPKQDWWVHPSVFSSLICVLTPCRHDST